MNLRSMIALLMVLLFGVVGAMAQQSNRMELVPQTGHTAGVTAVAIRPGADQVLSASSDGTAILWDAKTGRQLRVYKGGPLSNSFVVAAELQEADMPPTFPLAAKETPCVAAVEFGPDGSWFVMVCGSEGFLAFMNANSQAIVWDTESGERIRAFDLQLDAGAIALSRDGKQLLSGGEPMDPTEAKEMTEMGATIKPTTGVVLWDIATGKEIRQYGGYDTSYSAVQFSPDGKYVLGGGRDMLGSFATPSGGVEAPAAPAPVAPLAPSAAPPAPAPATASDSGVKPNQEPASKEIGVVCLWEVATGEQILAIRPRNAVTKSRFSPSGQQIATIGVEGALEVWDVETKERLLDTQANAAVFSADGKQLIATDAAGTVSVWNLADGKKVRSVAAGLESVKGIALSSDGSQLLVGMSNMLTPPATAKSPLIADPNAQSFVLGEAVLIDVASGRIVRSFLSRMDPMGFVAVSPTGQLLLIGDNVWDVKSGQKLRNLCDKLDDAFSAAFSPDGKRVLLANHSRSYFMSGFMSGLFGSSSDKELAALVDVLGGAEPVKFLVKYPVENRVALGISDDGKRAFTTTRSGTIGVWNVADGKKVSESVIPCDKLAAAFSPDGRLAAVSFDEKKIVWWDRKKGEKVSREGREQGLPVHPGMPPANARDGKPQLTVSDDGTALVLQDAADAAATRTLEADLTPYESIRSAGFDQHDDRFVYAEISSPYAGFWDLSAGKRLHEFSLDEPFSADVLAFSPDGNRVVTAGDDGQATIWEVPSGKRVAAIKLDSPIMAATFSPDAARLVAGCADRTVVIVTLADNAKTVLHGHEGPVDAVAFRPDGKLLVTACRQDGTARIWDVAGDKELARIISINDRKDWLILTPEGAYDGSEGGCKQVAFRIGEGLHVQPAEHFSAEGYQPQKGLLKKVWNAE